MHDATRVIRAGIPDPSQGQPFLPGPTFAAPFHVAGDPTRAPYTYSRFSNPTWTLFEKALGELEGGEAVVFASGMAATAGDAQGECLEGARLLWLESPSNPGLDVCNIAALVVARFLAGRAEVLSEI